MKKFLFIFFSLTIFGLKFLVSPVSAAEDLCCPRGYSDSFWKCPVGTDRSKKCCRPNGFFKLASVVDKIPCNSDESTVTPLDDPITQNDLDQLNPLLLFSTKESQFYRGDEFVLGMFINQALNLIFPLAGLILFVMIVWGGFEMLTSATSKKGLDAGKQRVVSALIGFLLLFSSYWIIQIIEHITQVNILGQ
jgi:hypothetical protein